MKKGFLACFVGQITMLTIFSLSLLAMYFVEFVRDTKYEILYLRINGGVFWASLLFLIIASVLVSVLRTKDKDAPEKKEKRLPGALCFFRNLPAKITDIIAAISFVTTVVLFILDYKLIIPRSMQLTVFISLCVFTLSFGMHCILNGINFEYLTISRGGEKK